MDSLKPFAAGARGVTWSGGSDSDLDCLDDLNIDQFEIHVWSATPPLRSLQDSNQFKLKIVVLQFISIAVWSGFSNFLFIVLDHSVSVL